MIDIDFEALHNSVCSCLDERIIDGYDLDTIVRNAVPCWDNTAIQVKGTDFTIVVDSVSYDVVDYTGFDG